MDHQGLSLKFVDVQGVINLMDGFGILEKEKLAEKILLNLPAESKAKLFQKELSDSGLAIVLGGSNCSVRSELCMQIQNAPNVDLAAILEAIIARGSK